MNNFRIIPRLEIKSGNLIKGMRMEGLRKLGNPIEKAIKYYEDGADEIIYSDIVASLYSRPYDLKTISEIARNIHIPFVVGGGIHSKDDVHKILEAGADRVCINTGAIADPNIIYDTTREFGSQCITIEIQAKSIYDEFWEPFVENGRNRTNLNLFDWVKSAQELGAGEIFFNSIDGDGMKNGLDCNVIKKIRKNINIPFVAGGGVGSIEHILDLIDLGCNGVSISNILHFNTLSIRDIKLNIRQSSDCVRINE
jgi:imidazole glycerol-phosphate synthase subunit HisF